MPKKKKTREQKIQADMRRQSPVSKPQVRVSDQQKQTTPTEVTPQIQQATFSLSKEYTPRHHPGTPKDLVQESQAIHTNSYKYLAPDLIKTVFLTSSIIVAELLIKFFAERG